MNLPTPSEKEVRSEVCVRIDVSILVGDCANGLARPDMTIRERYADKYVRVRAYAHFMLHGLICAIALGFSAWGWFALFTPFLVEVSQMLTNSEYYMVDGIYDWAEGTLGGVVIGGLFFVQGVYFC